MASSYFYSYHMTAFCGSAKDVDILDLQLHSNQRMRGSSRRTGGTGLSC